MEIMSASTHIELGVEHNARAVAQIAPLSVGFTEMDPGPKTLIPELRKYMSGYRVLTDAKRTLGPHSQEVPIAVKRRDGLSVLGHSVVLLHSKVGDQGIGNDRYMTIARFLLHGKRYAHIQTHWMAGLQDNHGNVHPNSNARAHAMITAYHKMDTKLTQLGEQGYTIFVTGDFNYRVHSDREYHEWTYAPQALFRSHRLQWHEEGLDYLAWSHQVRKTNTRVVRPDAAANAGDHPWIIGSFERN
jgi:hypothetical protein